MRHETITDFANAVSPTLGANLCNSSDPCYLWVGISALDVSIAKKISEKIDGDNNVGTGNVRYFANHVYIKQRSYDHP